MVNANDTMGYLEAGARAAAMRQQVIANNLAHAGVPGFRRSAVEFESVLRTALEAGEDVAPAELTPEVVKPFNTPVNIYGNDVDLEMEIGELMKNSGKYKAYIRILGKMFQQLNLAVSGNP